MAPSHHANVIDFDETESQIPDDYEEDLPSEEEDDEEQTDLGTLMAQFFMEPKKQRNVTEVLCDIKKQMEIQNKLLAQIYTSLAASSSKA
jgi:hypothetical protein